MAAVTLLETVGLTKQYGGVCVNNAIDITLQSGHITALIGPNGAGKSTFVQMVTGRIDATEGQVLFEGRDISHLPAHKRIAMGMAYTFQITSIFAGLSLWENVALAVRRQLGNAPKQVSERVNWALGAVGLEGRAQQIAGDQSYGHQRLLEIAMGLAQDPKLFILDEPTQGLSESEIEEFITLIKTVSQKSTILIIEHNMDVVMRLCDHIIVLDSGDVLARGTPDQIHNNAAVQRAYLGRTDA